MLTCSNVGLDNRNKIGAIIVSVLLILVGFFFFMGDDEEEEEIEENNIPADTRITDDSLEEVSNSTNDDESTEESSGNSTDNFKILALHGGGDSPEGLESQDGMQDIMDQFPEYEFFFADSPEDGNVWIRDPPGGKDEPTTDRGWANTSIEYLDQIVEEHGPFHGILGYSQGCAMALVYMANSDTTFEKVMLFNGYLPTTHHGLNDTIAEAAPFDVPALIFGGEEDVFVYGVEELESVFVSPTVLVSSTADHHLPYSNDETFDNVIAFFNAPVVDTSEPPTAPDRDWISTVEGSQEESHGHFILACEDGGFLQVGETGFIPNGAKILVAKIKSDGSFAWKKEFGTLGHNLGNSAIEVSDGYVVVGSKDEDSLIMKLNKNNGSTIFSSTHNVGGSDAFESVVQISGGYVAVGYVEAEDDENTFYTEGEGHMVFLDNVGSVTAVKDLNSYMSHAYRIAVHNDELLVSGLTDEALDYALVKMDLEGNVIWDKTYGGSGSEHNFAFDVNSNGEMFLSGHTTSGTANWDTYTVKVDNDGILLWENITGNPRGFDPNYIHDEVWGLKATSDGGVVVVAGTGDEYEEYSKCNGDDCSDSWRVYLIKYSQDGTLEWEATFGPEEGGDWAGEDICLTSDGGAVVAVDNGNFGFLKIDPF